VRGAKLVSLPKVGHGFSVPRNWLPQFQKAFMDLVQSEEISTNTRTPSHASLTDLPLVEVPPREERTTTMSVILSGDGGWASIDRDLGNALAADGIAVVGVNSLQYFWTRRTPEGAATGLERILRHYFAAWKKDKAVLIGYSLGADVLPFMVNRLPQDLRARVPVVALLNPARTVDFEFHVIDWLVSASHPGSYALLPELQRLQGPKLLCFYGADETDSLCKDLPPQHGIAIRLQGGHHFNGKYEVLASRIMREAQVATDAARTE
ncbi:MAG: virulence factor family protein, partial [Candidatus Binatia bacterium]